MKIKRFNVYEDLSHINAWLVTHKHPPVTRLDIPEIGYIAWEHSTPVGSIFLRRCEGGMGIVDSLASNPECPPEMRDLALSELIKHIIEQAKHHKITKLVGFTRDENTLTRSVRLGFVQIPHAVVVLDTLKQESK